MFPYNRILAELYKRTYKSTKRRPEAIAAGIKRKLKSKNKHNGHNS